MSHQEITKYLLALADKEIEFLNSHYKKMPRTMLRYAIEKFSEQDRQDYSKGRI